MIYWIYSLNAIAVGDARRHPVDPLAYWAQKGVNSSRFTGSHGSVSSPVIQLLSFDIDDKQTRENNDLFIMYGRLDGRKSLFLEIAQVALFDIMETKTSSLHTFR